MLVFTVPLEPNTHSGTSHKCVMSEFLYKLSFILDFVLLEVEGAPCPLSLSTNIYQDINSCQQQTD